jgi:predicted HicB family RNase H-like nuclease
MEKTISMRLSEEDNQFIESEAKKERLSKSSWIRRKIFLCNK